MSFHRLCCSLLTAPQLFIDNVFPRNISHIFKGILLFAFSKLDSILIVHAQAHGDS